MSNKKKKKEKEKREREKKKGKREKIYFFKKLRVQNRGLFF